jgi:hypothetical protein
MRRIRAWTSPTLFLTTPESLLSMLVSLVALVALVTGAYVLAVPMFLILGFLGYRSQRRTNAAHRAGLFGFVTQATPVGNEELTRKVDALHRELGDWRPGIAWLDEVTERQQRGG